MFWKRKPKEEPQVAQIKQQVKEAQEFHKAFNTFGFYKGKRVTDYIEDVKQLKREEKYGEAEALLTALLPVAEEASQEIAATGMRWEVTPFPYEELAIIYRKQKRYTDEIAILERFACQPHHEKGRFDARLIKAKTLLAKANG